MTKELDLCDCNVMHTEVIERVRQKQTPSKTLEEVASFFKVFSDKTRLSILSLLLEEEMCVCDIAFVLGMSHSSISHQLRVLRQARIVKNRRDGKVVYYSLDDDHVRNILAQGIDHLSH